MTTPAARADRTGERPATSVTVYPDGPLVLRGDFEIRALGDEPLSTGGTVALCRCGRSAVKPFCDGSHKIARALRGTGAPTSRRD